MAEIKVRHSIRLERVEGADHFINDGPTDRLLAALDACLPQPRRFLPSLGWPSLPKADLAGLWARLRPDQRLRRWTSGLPTTREPA